MQPKNQKKPSRKKLRRVLLTTTLLLGSQCLHGIAANAVIAPAGQIIQNKATGSFIDTDNTEKAIFSNTVQVTVAEITGIRVDPLGVSGTVFLGNTIYFDFTVSNIGNDPTQFFIPSSPSDSTGGTPGTIEIRAYDPDGSGPAASVPLSGVIVTSGDATGNLPNASTFNNGSIPAGGTITVRIPMTVTATGNQPVSVTLGNTPVAPDNQNQTYIVDTNDLYTVDNSLLTNGDLVSGAPFNGVKEASATLSATAIPNITGTVFEDINYGGGAGRPFGTAGTVGRIGATVELYKSDGTYITSTTTIAGGAYTFTNVPANADYIVRVVNSTVSSSRPGSISTLLPVQTFRTDASTGTALADTDRVGGEKPSEEDAPVRSASQTLADLNALTNKEVQSVTAVKVGSTDTTAVDFGYNFDTIVNTNDSGQGSLRQFITNSNALTNIGLDQVPNPSPASGTTALDPAAGEETSIFMIPDGNVHNGQRSGLASGLTSGVAIITPTTLLPPITDSHTAINGYTQTINIGNTNSGSVLRTATYPGAVNGKVGTGADGVEGTADDPSITAVDLPEVQVQGNNTFTYTINVNAPYTTIKALAITGAGTATYDSNLALQGNILLTGSSQNTLIEDNVLGSNAASFTDPGAATRSLAPNIAAPRYQSVSNSIIRHNLIGFSRYSGVFVITSTNDGLLIENNQIFSNGYSGAGIAQGHATGLELISFEANLSGGIIKNNLIDSNGNQGIQSNLGTNFTIIDNTVSNNGRLTSGYDASEGQNILMFAATQATITQNIITGSNFEGIAIANTASNIKISKNSTFANGNVGIDHLVGAWTSARGVTPNDGIVGTGLANNGLDYPIITSSSLSGGALTVKGYVGNSAAGSATFANLTLEFFIADDDGNNNGAVIVGDGKNLPHGEGKTYIGSCTTGATGLFDCTFNNTVSATITNPKNITATATDSSGNTSEFSAPAVNNPNVLLVKRITAIKLKGSSSFTPNNSYIDDPTYAYDDNTITVPAPATPSDPPEDTDKWPDPTLYLQGLIDGGAVKPGDEVEFTIYFLSTGVTPAKSIALCDVLPKNMTFVADSFNGSSPTDTGSLGGENLGIAIANDATTLPSAPTTYLTNIGGDDQAQFIPPGTVPPAVCKDPSNSSLGLTAITNTTGAIYLQLRNDLPPATAQGAPTNSYGFIRFRARVN